MCPHFAEITSRVTRECIEKKVPKMTPKPELPRLFFYIFMLLLEIKIKPEPTRQYSGFLLLVCEEEPEDDLRIDGDIGEEGSEAGGGRLMDEL